MPSNTIMYSSDVARRLTKGYGSTTQPIYVKSDGTIGTCTEQSSSSTWATARTFTIGNTGKSVDGSANVSWSKAEILGSSTDANFYRGDQAWSNTLNGAFTANGTITSSGGYLKSTVNSNTVTIGSQNSSFTHIYNSASIPFIFNNSIETTTGNLGSASYPWNNLYIGKANGAGIYYVGSQNTYRMIRFVDNTGDIYGNGISIGGGGLVVIGAGESADTILSNLSLTASGGTETTYIGADSSIDFYPGINSWDASAKLTMTASRFWAGVNGNTTREAQVGVQSGSGQIYMWSAASATGNRGIYVTAHGSGSARAAITIGTNNEIYYADGYNGASTRLAYSQSALAGSAISYLACWNGYELRAISKAEVFNAVRDNGGDSRWVNVTGDTMTGNLTISGAGAHWTKWVNTTTKVSIEMWSDTRDQGIYTRGYWTGSAYTASAGWILYRSTDSYVHTSFRLYGAVWNDYAETREVEKVEPGRVVTETSNGQMILSTERLQPGCKVVSDTYGFALGKIDEKHMPIAVAGRVLVYPYRDRNEYILGAAVCSAPNGTVDIMTREEIIQYPERIIGTVSEIPDYDIWSGGDHHSEGGTIENVPVNGRIWIYVR